MNEQITQGYIHIGPVKTGSTYLQKVFFENRHIFEQFGLAYPFTENLDFERYGNSGFLHGGACDAAKIRAELQAHPKFLLSEEGLFFRPWNLENPVFEGIPKKIILYARRPAELIVSWAAENAKPYNAAIVSLGHSTGPLSIETGMDQLSRIYEEGIWRFISYSAGARDRLNATLLSYSREAAGSETFLTNFIDSLGLNSAEILSDPEFKKSGIVNQSYSRKFYDISLMTWRALGKPSNMSVFNHTLVETLTANYPYGDDRPVLETISDAVIENFTNSFKFWENFLSDRFLGGQPVFASSYPDCFGVARRPYQPIDEKHFLSFLKQAGL